MPLNANRSDLWKDDIARSIDFYNRWFIEFAPSAYQTQRAEQQQRVKHAFEWTQNLTQITPDVLRAYPSLTRFFLNQSRAISTNVFLHLYPKPFVMRLLESNAQRQMDLLESLEAISLRETTENGRVYGGGLHKTEPGELKSIPIRQMPEWLSKHLADAPQQLTFLA